MSVYKIELWGYDNEIGIFNKLIYIYRYIYTDTYTDTDTDTDTVTLIPLN